MAEMNVQTCASLYERCFNYQAKLLDKNIIRLQEGKGYERKS